MVEGEAAAAGVLQLALVDVKQHAGDEGELAEAHVEKVAIVAAGKRYTFSMNKRIFGDTCTAPWPRR